MRCILISWHAVENMRECITPWARQTRAAAPNRYRPPRPRSLPHQLPTIWPTHPPPKCTNIYESVGGQKRAKTIIIRGQHRFLHNVYVIIVVRLTRGSLGDEILAFKSSRVCSRRETKCYLLTFLCQVSLSTCQGMQVIIQSFETRNNCNFSLPFMFICP